MIQKRESVIDRTGAIGEIDGTNGIHREDDRQRQTETRDAVETAIDLAKNDKSVSWEVAISRSHKKVTRWKDLNSVGGQRTTKVY